MTFLSGTPVECTIHPALWPGPRNYTPTVNEASDNDLDWSLYHSDNPEQMVSNFHVPTLDMLGVSHTRYYEIPRYCGILVSRHYETL